ncbi:hypothetical protein [Enterococcus rivorum]|uniref:hypothetical protein n=1 Tax=Enterococcus rivorum TaxID=762845 RepID=UPI003629AF16
MKTNIENPKYNSNDFSFIYRYYAGFSTSFVSEILSGYNLDNLALLDPWNGSGTTSRVACQLGVKKVYGFDINPIMSVIASGELAEYDENTKLDLKQRNYLMNRDILQDPLEQWFTKTSVKNIRNTELNIRNAVLLEESAYEVNYLAIFPDFYELLILNHKLAYTYLVLFEVVKKLTEKFKSTNPTWIKIAKSPNEKIKITQNEFQKLFLSELEAKNGILEKKTRNLKKEVQLGVSDSRTLPLEDESIDLTITSPPYCTRIDYAVATRVELAVWGCLVTAILNH